MQGFSATGGVQDDKIIKLESGHYAAKITKVEEKQSEKGNYLALTIKCYPSEGKEFEVYDNLFINSKAEYPIKYVKRWLTILGFWKRNDAGEVQYDIADFNQIKMLQFNVILRREEEWSTKKGAVTDYFKVFGFYNMQYLSSGEILEGKETAEKFASDLEWVKANPIKKMKEAAPAAPASAPGNGRNKF